MKIAFFATGVPWLKPSGGRERRVWEIAKHMAKKGHDIIFICSGKEIVSQENNIVVVYIKSFNTGWHHLDLVLNRIYFLFRAHARLLSKQDVWYCSRAPLGIIWSRAKKIADCGRLWILHWSPITLLDNFTNLLGYIFSNKKIFNSRKNIVSSKDIVINPGIDLKKFKPMKLKKIYDILFVGRKETAKGYHDFLEITKELPNLRYKIATDEKNMPRIYNQSKILVHPSYGESYSQTVLEALACGITVIAYDTVAKEFFEECIIIKQGNIDAMIKAIKRFKTYKHKPDKKWLQRFDKNKYLKKIEKVIENGGKR